MRTHRISRRQWRRLVVPDAYGDAGLRRINPLRGGGRYTPEKAGFVIKPHGTAYVELILVDGGSGRCERVLRPPGVSEEAARRLRSTLCVEAEGG